MAFLLDRQCFVVSTAAALFFPGSINRLSSLNVPGTTAGCPLGRVAVVVRKAGVMCFDSTVDAAAGATITSAAARCCGPPLVDLPSPLATFPLSLSIVADVDFLCRDVDYLYTGNYR